MGIFDRWRRAGARRKLLAAVRSSDWFVAEAAIARVPSELPPGEAFDVLQPLSRGAGHRLANPLTQLTPSPTLQLLADAHISKALAAMKQVNDRRVAPHLATIVTELPNFAGQAIDALGSPHHGHFATELGRLAPSWPQELGNRVRNALWGMATTEALEAVICINKEDGWPFPEEHTRRVWAEGIAERQNPELRIREVSKRRPLP
jgi:hypothetical protein